MGMNNPVHVLQRGDEVNDIVNMAAIAVVDVQNLSPFNDACEAVRPAGSSLPPLEPGAGESPAVYVGI